MKTYKKPMISKRSNWTSYELDTKNSKVVLFLGLLYKSVSVDYDKIIEERRLAAEEEERQRKEFEMKVRSDIFLGLRFFRRSV